MKLAYQLWKPSESRAKGAETKLVFLHGMGGTGALWRPVGSALEDDFEVLALDQRGHGKSRVTGPATYTPLDYGRDVIETLESLSFHPAWLIGHSMGVRTACAAAHLKPEWIQGLVLIDLGFDGMAGGGLGESLASFLRILPLEFPSRAAARDFMNLNSPDPAIAQYLLAVSTASPEGRLSFPFDRSALLQTIEDATPVRAWVQEIASRGTPILVLRGLNSSVWSHEEFEAERARFAACPNAVFEEIPGAGHGLPFEQRALFVKRLSEFISNSP